jgi:3-deoxy-7-phosphoheptulonate synthase
MNAIKLAAREGRSRTIVKVGRVEFGRTLAVIAGPCSVESEEQTLRIAYAVKAAGADMLRGGAFKPRTSPYAFQGLGLRGLKFLARAREKTGLPVISEVLDPRDATWMSEYVDVLQVGARNMQNFSLLKEVGRCGKPVLLKRGMQATLAEWLNCAEYILDAGNPDVILCERGIRTFETHLRNTLDLSAVPALRALTHLPVIVDPTHSTGRVDLVPPMSLAAVAAGADGLIVEVHDHPDEALCDREQAMLPDAFAEMMIRIRDLKAFLDGSGQRMEKRGDGHE